MTLREHFKAGYELFGPEAMKRADQYFAGEIDYKTFMDNIDEVVLNYRIYKIMWDDIETTNPKIVKVTSRFATYLSAQGVEFTEMSDELLESGIIGQFDVIDIEIDDTIKNEYYELVY